MARRLRIHSIRIFSECATSQAGPDTAQAARALHLAVAQLRSEKVSSVRWVPFIYLGGARLCRLESGETHLYWPADIPACFFVQ